MVELVAISPLRRHADRATGRARSAGAELLVAEAPACELTLLTADLSQGSLRPAVEAVLGAALPDANRQIRADQVSLFWQGPRDTLLMAPPGTLAAIRTALAPHLAGRAAALTDVSSQWALLEISGPAAARTLARGTQVDLAGPAASLAMTRLAGLAATILFDDPARGLYRVLVERSHADHLWLWLTR